MSYERAMGQYWGALERDRRPLTEMVVYGTADEARRYAAEEMRLPGPILPVSVRPPLDIRTGPVRTVTIYPRGHHG